ncbi:MAG: hypothetical protein MJZ41_14985 [Bacteroidaceae bacterium]|nr:hypothetical protein [Bacteroidaceae bacterium]
MIRLKTILLFMFVCIANIKVQSSNSQIAEGTDCTDMLVNPKFTDPNGTGWAVTDGKNGKCGNYTLRGGFNNFPVAESWHATFDVFQEIDGVPDGIYSLSLNGFCRLDDGETEVAAEIYMNEFATTLLDLNSPEQMVKNDDDAIDGFNCYKDASENGGWATNPVFLVEQADGTFVPCGHSSPANRTDSQVDIAGTTYLAPGGMEGASVAFSANRYQAKVYGLVEGGKMRLGIRNTTSTHQWALWSNFTLTYEGKPKDVILDLLRQYIERLENYTADNVDNMTNPVKTAAVEPIPDAKTAVSAQDVDAMYQSLFEVNAAMVAAKENVAAVNAFKAAKEDINAALEGNPGAKGLAAYVKISDKIYGYKALSTVELNELTEQMKEVVELLRIPSTEGASDDNPVDMTSVIVNADFEQNAKEQQATGWTLVKGEGASGNYQVQTGYDGGVSMEFWSNTNGSGTKYDFYQRISNLPAGTYELTADASNSLNEQEAGPGEGAAYIYAAAANGDALSTLLSAPIAVQEPGCRDAYEKYSVIVKLADGEDLVIGSKSIGNLSARWVMIDNFNLYYLGTESAKKEPQKLPKVQKPTISYENNKIKFGCTTENVRYHYTYSVQIDEAESTSSATTIDFPQISRINLTLSVYATSDGYDRSDVTKRTFNNIALKNYGDMNNDGDVNIADITELINIVLGKGNGNDTHEYVDLDLPSGTLWATMNVGAESPEDYGNYYAWGETKAYGEEDTSNAHNYSFNNNSSYKKTYYYCSTYKWCNDSNSSSFTKYNTDSSRGIVDNKKVLELADDAAYVNWGENWRMPTHAEMQELYNNCTWTWTSLNGKDGFKVSSKKDSSKYIFLPAAGYRDNGSLSIDGRGGFFWSSSLYEDYPFEARYLSFDWGRIYPGYYDYDRYLGFSVRPVRRQ